MDKQTKKKSVLLAVILGAVALAVVIAAIIIVPKLANKGNQPDDGTTAKTPSTSAGIQSDSEKQETEPNTVFSVILPEELKNDEDATKVFDSMIRDFSIGKELPLDYNENDEMISSIISNSEVTINSADGENCEMTVRAIDVPAMIETIADRIPEGTEYEQIREMTVKLATEMILAGDFKKIERTVDIPVTETENGTELGYTFNFVNAILGGMLDRYENDAKAGDSE